MKYQIDHDIHIHTYISPCSSDPEQNMNYLIQYAKRHGFKYICTTDHFWDLNVYKPTYSFYENQSIEKLKTILPFPKDNDVKIYFGAEADMDKDYVIGVSKEVFDQFDFVIIALSHLHASPFTIRDDPTLEEYREAYINRLYAFLNNDSLPFKKMGIAHVTCPFLGGADSSNHIKILKTIPDETFIDIFNKARERGCGIELNVPVTSYNDEELDVVMRPLVIAKKCGCKFYLGGDSHHPADEESCLIKFQKMIDYLDLQEEDKFIPETFKK